MSPPLVSLSKKEPHKATFDDLPLDKEDTVTVSTIGTENHACNARLQRKQRRCRFIACAITLIIVVAVAAALTFTLVKVLRKHRSTWTVPGNAGQSTDVAVDDKNKLIHTSHKHGDHQGEQGKVVVLEILHEYSRHLIAYKDMSNSTCYIDRLDETFEVGYERWESYERDDRKRKALQVLGDPIEVEVLQHIGDIHIYGHCFSGNSYWVMEYEEKEVTTAVKVVVYV